MKKFMYLLNILLLLLIPTALYIAVENDTISYRTNIVSSTKMIKTTILVDRSNKKKEIREEEERKREEEALEARRLALKEEEERKNKEALIKANAVKSASAVTKVQVVEQIGSLESSGNALHGDGDVSSSDSNVGDTTTVIVGSSEKAYVGYKFSGSMSAYGRDCCSSNPDYWGQTASGFNIYTNGMYYNDSEYGRGRILAASKDDFYLYSVMQVNDPIDGAYRAIVLDRGDKNIGIGRRFVFDLVVESQEWARLHYGVHRNVDFEVLRLGK